MQANTNPARKAVTGDAGHLANVKLPRPRRKPFCAVGCLLGPRACLPFAGALPLRCIFCMALTIAKSSARSSSCVDEMNQALGFQA